jgi:hypothetical protein
MNCQSVSKRNEKVARKSLLKSVIVKVLYKNTIQKLLSALRSKVVSASGVNFGMSK